jgi:hypothetical protein
VTLLIPSRSTNSINLVVGVVMTKPRPFAAPFDLLTNSVGALPNAGARAQAFWAAQANALEHVRAFADEWWGRRLEAASSAADCCAKLAANAADPAASAGAWSAWAQGAFERLSGDVKAQTELAATLAADAVKALGAPSTELASHSRGTHKEAVTSSKASRSKSESLGQGAE